MVALTQVRMLFKILIIFSTALLGFGTYGFLKIIEIQCIDAGEACINRIRILSDPASVLFVIAPIVLLFLAFKRRGKL